VHPRGTPSSSLAALAFALTLSCRAEPPDPGSRDERIVILLESPPRELDPRFATESSSTKVTSLIFAGLTTVETPDLAPVPDLAEQVAPACPEGTMGSCRHWVAVLREGLSWHDGHPLRARDAVYTWTTLLDPALGSPFGGELRRKIARVWSEGSREVHFELREPDALFPVDLAVGLVPAHLLEGDGPPRRLEVPVGAGPYRFLSRYGDVKVVLERFPGYHRGRPPARYLVLRVIRDEATRMLALLAGSADLAVNNLSPPLLRTLEDEPRLEVDSAPAACTTYLAMNLSRAPLDRAAVRRALALALDRRSIVDHMFEGRALLAAGLLPPLHWAHAPGLEPVPTDPAAAEGLLDAAGLPRDPVTGVRLTLTLKTTTDRFRQSVGRVLADQLSAAGVATETVPLELATLLADVRGGNYDLYVLQVPEVIDPDILRWLLHSQGTPVPEGGIGDTEMGRVDRRFLPPRHREAGGPFAALCRERWVPAVEARARELRALVESGGTLPLTSGNRTFFADPEADCLLDLARGTMDRTRRRAFYGRVEEVLLRELPLLPLWHEDNVAVSARRLRDYRLLPINRYGPLTEASLEIP